jgi:chromosomal replication initiator protein
LWNIDTLLESPDKGFRSVFTPFSREKAAQSKPVDKNQKTDHLKPLWKSIATALRAGVTPEIYDRWFKEVEPVEIGPDRIVLRVPNDIYRFWIEDNYLGSLRAAIMLALNGSREVQFVSSEVAQIPSPPPVRPAVRPVETEEDIEERAAANGMNPRNTFETFVVGTNNEFAHAACFAVAQNPGKVYNPLFFYGGVGLGKTHLMHAIGQHIMVSKKGAKVCYVSSERFTNEFIDAIQNGSIVKFRKRYRQVDVLLIDDIHFFAGKERSQEEFFHTFNTLFDGHKQIVLSSDRPPAEIGNLEPRLVSRFEWGLAAELQPPDVETRTAILRKKASALGVELAPELIEFLAQRIRTNIRRLEGALMRVASFISLSGGNPSPEKVEMLLKDLLQEEARRSVSIEQIQKRVAEHFDVRFADMTSKRKPKNIAFPRQIAMYLARELTKGSLCEIGDAFGGRDHGTVLYAHRIVKDRIHEDEKVRQVVKFLNDQLQR